MPKTQISDVIVPSVFVPYVIERTAELSALFQSGIVSRVGVALGGDLTEGGTTVNMPFWADLDGDDEVLSDTNALTPGKISAKKDVAVLHFRGKAWSANDLAAQLSGDDPMGAIAELVASWWARKQQKVLISTLKGAFAAASAAGNVHSINAGSGEAAVISGKTFIDASQKLGDAQDRLVAVAMHSATRAELAKKDLIQTIRDSEGRTLFDTFMGKRVIVDDSMPVAGDVYTTYLFGEGAVGYQEGGVLRATETDRDILAGDDVMTNRRAFILHPRGIMWKGSPTGASPTNTELEVGTNWERVYSNKNIRIVQFNHKIVAA